MTGERVTSASPSGPGDGPGALDPLPPVWRWPVARWATFAECAGALGVTTGELEWFADARRWNWRAAGALRHYSYRWLPTKSGGQRLIERPKPRLAELQRRVQRHVLAGLPVHEAAHGFRPGRSALTCAAPHAGRAVVVRMDLEAFFPSITASRTKALLELAGYPDAVAAALAGILTTATPPDVVRGTPRRARERLLRTHLPQGAPSSPAVANAVTHHLDRRLSGLAGVLDAIYTRYADDLTFSGEDLPLHRLLPGVRRIVTAEGFATREDKTSVRRAHQQQRVAGLVVNTKPAAARAQYDELRATLRNCVTTGPAAQNRAGHPDFAAHLRGRIAWIEATSARRGAKLKELFERIDWS